MQELYGQGLLSGAEREELKEERLSDSDYRVFSFEQTGELDFRNYVFSDEELDSTILLEDEFI